MNERIRQLAEQAGFYVAGSKIYIPSTSEDITTCQTKFAELIVAECVAICEDTEGEHIADARWGRLCCALEIKQHFGVEE